MKVIKALLCTAVIVCCLSSCAQSQIPKSLFKDIGYDGGICKKEILVRVVELEKNFIHDTISFRYGLKPSSTCMTFLYKGECYSFDIDSTCLSEKWNLIRGRVEDMLIVTLIFFEEVDAVSEAELPYTMIVDVKPYLEARKNDIQR